MLKYALLGAAMAVTAPALAQTAPQTAITSAPAPVAADPAATQAVPAPQAAAPATDGTAQIAPAEQAAAAATPAPADQVAAVVDQNFASYDKDADGKLNETEFAAWMVALKSQSDPETDANAPATRQWNKAAFAQADTDKSRSLTKAELTGFLTPSANS